MYTHLLYSDKLMNMKSSHFGAECEVCVNNEGNDDLLRLLETDSCILDGCSPILPQSCCKMDNLPAHAHQCPQF